MKKRAEQKIFISPKNSKPVGEFVACGKSRRQNCDYYDLKNTDAPAVSVKNAFIDNFDDAKFLVDRQNNFTRAIARGITDYFQNEKPLPDVVNSPKYSSESLIAHFKTS